MAEWKHWLLERIRGFDGLPAVATKDGTVSYSELACMVDECHGFLDQHQNTAGMVTAVLADYGPRAIALFLALMARKNIVAPLTSTTPNEIRASLDQGRVEQAFRVRDKEIEPTSVAPSQRYPPSPCRTAWPGACGPRAFQQRQHRRAQGHGPRPGPVGRRFFGNAKNGLWPCSSFSCSTTSAGLTPCSPAWP